MSLFLRHLFKGYSAYLLLKQLGIIVITFIEGETIMLTKQSIKEVVTKEVLSVHENQILSDVAKIFRESMVHHVPVKFLSKAHKAFEYKKGTS